MNAARDIPFSNQVVLLGIYVNMRLGKVAEAKRLVEEQIGKKLFIGQTWNEVVPDIIPLLLPFSNRILILNEPSNLVVIVLLYYFRHFYLIAIFFFLGTTEICFSLWTQDNNFINPYPVFIFLSTVIMTVS